MRIVDGQFIRVWLDKGQRGQRAVDLQYFSGSESPAVLALMWIKNVRPEEQLAVRITQTVWNMEVFVPSARTKETG